MILPLAQFTVGLEQNAFGVEDSGIFISLLQGVGAVLLIAVLLSLALWIARLITHRFFRERRGFEKVIYKILVPKESAEKKGELEREKSLEEIREDVSVAEAFFSTLGGLKAERGLASWFAARADEFSFEIVALHGVIAYYVAAPRRYESILVQQINAHFSQAHVEPVEDYNLFSPQGTSVGAYLTARRHHLFPFKTYRKIETEPVETLHASLSRIGDAEGAAIQYIVRSAKREWRHRGVSVASEMQKGTSVANAIAKTTVMGAIREFFSKEKKQEGQKSRELSPLEVELQKSIQEKSSKAGLDVVVRLVASAATAVRARQIVDDIANAFTQYNSYEYGNSWTKAIPGGQQHLLRDFIHRSFEETKATVLSADELASLFHLPLPRDATPNILWLAARTAPPPVAMPAEGTDLGIAEYRGEETPVRMKQEDRMRHVYIIGMTGVGKSTLMEYMIMQDIKQGKGVCIIDPHGEFVEHTLPRIPKSRVDDVVLFDPGDIDRPMGLNMLEYDPRYPEQKTFLINEMIKIFDKLYDLKATGGPMFEQYMRNAMILVMDHPESGSTLMEIPKVLSDESFRKMKLEHCTTQVVKDFWIKEAQKAGGEASLQNMVPYITSKLTPFIANDYMRPIIGQQESAFNVRDIMDSGKILLLKLSKGKIGDMNAYLIGMVLVGKILMAALSRVDAPEKSRRDFFLYIDEFQNFITDSISTILSEARKYRLGLVIAHQYMGQLTKNNDTTVRDAVLGNAGTKVAFRIGIDDAEVLEKEFSPTFNSYDLVNIPKYTAYLRLLIDNTASKPFNMKTVMPPPGDPKISEALRHLSRLTYGRDRALVEAEILDRSSSGGSSE